MQRERRQSREMNDDCFYTVPLLYQYWSVLASSIIETHDAYCDTVTVVLSQAPQTLLPLVYFHFVSLSLHQTISQNVKGVRVALQTIPKREA